MGELSRESVIAEVQEITRRLRSDTLRRQDFVKESSTPLHYVYNLFPDDGWRGVLTRPVFGCRSRGLPIPDERRCLRNSTESSARWAEYRRRIQLDARGEHSFRSTRSGLAVSRAR